jgi:hypothetical protein
MGRMEVVMVSQIQKDKSHVFSYMYKVEPKDKHIHKYRHEHLCVMFVVVGLLEGTQRRSER